MAPGWLATLAARPLLMDGGMGSSLEDRGVDVRNPLWGSVALLDGPGRALCEALHRDFVAAGAELIIANSHNASLASCAALLERCPERLEPALRQDLEPLTPRARAHALMRRVNRSAVEAARRGAPGQQIIAAGIGSPEGAYATESRIDAAEAVLRIRGHAQALIDAGVDLLIFETLSTRAELQGVAAWLAGQVERPPVGIGLTTGDDGRTLAGVSMAEVQRMFAAAPPELVFVQCTRFDLVERSLSLLAEAGARWQLGAYGNDGRRWIDQRWHGERVSPEAYAETALRWRALGARIIGGCCGTAPEHVAALARVLAA